MTALFENRDLASQVADKLKVFAQPQRLMILSCLRSSERNVAEIGEATGVGQPALSQQLAELRRAGLVAARREAKQVWYSLANDDVAACISTMEAMFARQQPVAAPPRSPQQASAPRQQQGVAGFAWILRP